MAIRVLNDVVHEAIVAALATITVANGYLTDVANVRNVAADIGAAGPLPELQVLFRRDDIQRVQDATTIGSNKFTARYSVSGLLEALTDRPALELAGDVKQCLEVTNYRLGLGQVRDIAVVATELWGVSDEIRHGTHRFFAQVVEVSLWYDGRSPYVIV